MSNANDFCSYNVIHIVYVARTKIIDQGSAGGASGHRIVSLTAEKHKIEYNRNLTPVGTFDVSVSMAATFLARKPHLV